MTSPSRPDTRAAPVQVCVASTESEREAVLQVRRAVFIEEQGVPEDLEMDELDAAAVHLVAKRADRVVGVARLFPESNAWHVGRVAVMKEYRGQGFGRALMDAARSEILNRGGERIVLDAQVYVTPFYTRLGYSSEGEVFVEAGIPHRRMTMDLAPPRSMPEPKPQN